MADGSIVDPFTDLATAFENPRLKSGHTIYLRQGTHPLSKVVAHTVAGVTVRSYPGELAVIDCGAFELDLNASVDLRDLTVTSSVTTRDTEEPLSRAMDGIIGAMVGNAGTINLTNVRLVATSNVGWWTGSTGTWKGVLVQDTGWDAPDRGHGHVLYTQNKASDGLKTVTACIFVKGYGGNLRLYGSSASILQGYRISDSIFMHERALIGGSPVDDVQITNCMFYSAVQWGYREKDNQSASISNSFMRYTQVVRFWQSLTMTGCVVLAGNGDCVNVQIGQYYTNLHFDNNVYISSKARPFAIDGDGWRSFAEWQAETGQDANSRFYTSVADAAADGALTVPIVKVFPVNEGNHIANIAIWNPLEDATVDVDLSALALDNGDYELRQVRDYDNDRRQFAYSGSSVTVSMSGTTQWPPGYPTPYHPETVPANALPEFGAFELWRV